MDKGRIITLLDCLEVKAPSVQKRTGWIVSSCPLAPWRHRGGLDRSPSFGVRIKPLGISRFNCFSCGAHGELVDLVREFSTHNGQGPVPVGWKPDVKQALSLIAAEEEDAILDIPDYGDEAKKEELIHWDESWLKQWDPLDAGAQAYLLSRQIAMHHYTLVELLEDVKRKRILFIMRDWDGKLVGCHSRSYAGGKPPYLGYKWDPDKPNDPFTEGGFWNGLPCLGENLVDRNMTIILTEGPMDYLSPRRVYPNVLCALSVGMSIGKVKRLNTCSEIITFFDVGTGGDRARERLDDYLDGPVLAHVVPPEEYGDAGAMPLAALRVLLEDYVSV